MSDSKDSKDSKEVSKENVSKCTQVFICPICFKTFKLASQKEKHEWRDHPTNEFERAWRDSEKGGFKNVSTFYRDDPYY